MEIDFSLISDSNIYLFFVIVPFFVQLGVFPIGLMFFILLAGANSENISELVLLFLLIFLSSSIGDITAFLIAKYFSKGYLMKKLLKRKRFEKYYKISKKYFKKRGSFAVFVTRFLLTGIGPYLNYIVGLQRFDTKIFIKYVLLGEIIYSAELLFIGFYFRDTFINYYEIIYFLGIVIFLLFIVFENRNYFHKQINH